MNNLRKKEKGISLILLILIIVMLFAGCIYIASMSAQKANAEKINYETYYNDEYEDTENEALRYYYNQLEEPAKIMYTTILENEDALKSGIKEIKFPTSVGDSVKNLGGDENSNYFQSAWDALTLDNLNLFYVDTNNLSISTKTTTLLSYKSYEYTLGPQTGKKYYNSSFNTEEDINEAFTKIDEVVNEILSKAKGTRYQKILYVHDWLVDNVEYDNDNTANNDNIYGTFINRKVVCEGYAEALKYLLDKLNIPCVLVYGNGYDEHGNIEAHAWNYVKMENGKWYAIDATWDDPLIIGGNSNTISNSSYKYNYFLKGANTFNKNHQNDGDVSGTGQNFIYPELSKDDYKIN